MDRDKVIGALGEIAAYFRSSFDAMYGTVACEKFRGYAEAAEQAIALLKAQEPVKPVPAIDDVGDWLCGNCYQSVVGEEELDASGFVPVKFNFCPNCGRAVKWE